nr:hypothetical protein TetV2_00471 [Oceanusvirus sp.]
MVAIPALVSLAAYLKKRQREKIEGFSEISMGTTYTLVTIGLWLLNIITSAYALYLSFRRNNGFNIGAFIIACCCPLCYIIYHFAVPV